MCGNRCLATTQWSLREKAPTVNDQKKCTLSYGHAITKQKAFLSIENRQVACVFAGEGIESRQVARVFAEEGIGSRQIARVFAKEK